MAMLVSLLPGAGAAGSGQGGGQGGERGSSSRSSCTRGCDLDSWMGRHVSDPRRSCSFSLGEESSSSGDSGLPGDNISAEYLRSIAVELNNVGADLHNILLSEEGEGEEEAEVDEEGMDMVMRLFKESVSSMMDAGKDPEERAAQFEHNPSEESRNYKEKLELLVDAKMNVYKKRQLRLAEETAIPLLSTRSRDLRDLMLFKPDSVLDAGTTCFDEAVRAMQIDAVAEKLSPKSSSIKKKASTSPATSSPQGGISVGSAAVFNMGLLQLRRSNLEDDDGLLEAAMKLFRMSLGVAKAAEQERNGGDFYDDSSNTNANKRAASIATFRDQIYAHTNLGHGLYAHGRFEEAGECFLEALAKQRWSKKNLFSEMDDPEEADGTGTAGKTCARRRPRRSEQARRRAAEEDVTAYSLLRLNLARTYVATGQFREATEACQRALEAVRALSDEIGGGDREEAATTNNENLDTIRTALTYNMGFLYHEQGRHKEALELFCAFLERISSACDDDATATDNSEEPLLRPPQRTSEAITALTKILLIKMEGETDYEAAKQIVDVLLHLEQAQDQVGYDHVGLCSILRCVGSALMERGENHFAVRYFLEALRIERDASEESGGQLSQEVVVTLNSVGECYHMSEDLERASEFYDHALRLRGRWDDNENALHQDQDNERRARRARLNFIFAVVMYNNGRVKYELGQHEDASSLFGDAANLAVLVASSFRDDPSRLSECASLQHNIGQYKLELGRTSDALKCFERSLETRTSVLGNDDPAVAESLYQLGKLYHGMGDNVSALRAFDESMRIERDAFGESHPNVAMTLYNMAQIRYGACELDVALGMFQRVLEMLTRHPSDVLSLGEVHSLIGSIQGELGLVSEARESLAMSARLGGGLPTDDNYMCASSLVELANSRPAAAA